MRAILLPFAAYVLVPISTEFIQIEPWMGQLAKILIVGGLLLYFRKEYAMKLRLDYLALGAGLVIAALWIGLEGWYPFLLGTPEMVPTDIAYVILRLSSGVLVAPIIEEFFTRFFLNRALQAADWKKVPLGKFTVLSFAITTAFFGLSHMRWLPGLITGALLNLVLMRQKRIESCVLAHAIANICLGIYVITTGQFFLWG